MSANPVSPAPPGCLTRDEREALWLLQSNLEREVKSQREELRLRRLTHDTEVESRLRLIGELEGRADALAKLLRKDEPPYDGF